MDLMGHWPHLLVAALLCGLVAHELGRSRGRANGAFLLGFVLGPLAWLVLLVLPRSIENEAERRVAIEQLAAQLRAELAKLERQAGSNAPHVQPPAAQAPGSGDAAGFKAWCDAERDAGREHVKGV